MKKLKKTDIVPLVEKNLTAVNDTDVLPPEIMKLLEDKIPPWLQEFEADGSAVLRWNHELLIMFEEILRLDHGWTEPEIERFEKRIKEMLPIVHQMKMEDTKLLRKHDFAIAYDAVERNKLLFKAEKAGISLPEGKGIKKLK